MSFFTRIRDIATAPLKSVVKADPLLNRLTTGHFTGGFKGFRERTAQGVHELYKVDKLAQRLGVKEKHVVNVVMVAGVVVATYFTAGAASGALSGAGAGAGAGAGVGTGLTTGITAGDILTAAQAVRSIQQARGAKKEQQEAQAQAEREAVTASEMEKQAVAAQQAVKPADPAKAIGAGLILVALAASLL